MSNNKKPNSFGDIVLKIVVGIIFVAIAIGLSECGGCASSDIAYDEDGFLNMSDGFWEWMRKQ